MNNTFENDFYSHHIRANITTLIRSLQEILPYSTFSNLGLVSYVDFTEFIFDMDNDDNGKYNYSYYEAPLSGGYYLTLENGEEEYLSDLPDMAAEIADYYDLPLSNYRHEINTWVAVSHSFYEFLGDCDERVAEYEGLYIWGTFTNSENEPLYTLDRVQEFLELHT